VLLAAELSEPAYCYLIAYNTDGTEQLFLPRSARWPPPRVARLEDPDWAFTLNDRVGMQAFVLVAARQPLPAFEVWKEQRKKQPAWPSLPPQPDAVWRDNGQGPYPLVPGVGDKRGQVGELRGVPPLAALGRALRAAPRVDAVASIAFPVLKAEAP
jgi:hypothetical protein